MAGILSPLTPSVLLLSLLSSPLLGQITFERTYGGPTADDGLDVGQTLDGGYVITGSTDSFASGGPDVFLVRTDERGDTLWTRTYGGGAMDRGECVRQTSDGGYVIGGSTSSFGSGRSDLYLIRTDAEGDTVWTRTWGDTLQDYGHSVRQTQDGGYVIAGMTHSFGTGDYSDVYVIKTNPDGNVGVTLDEPSVSVIPKRLSLLQNYPNPFNPTTTIPFHVPGEGEKLPHVILTVYDVRGRSVRNLLDRELHPGVYEVVWDGKDRSGREVPSGIYLCTLSSDRARCSSKLVLLK
jgi:hypothetical protein